MLLDALDGQLAHTRIAAGAMATQVLLTAHLHTLFALANLWMARRSLMGARA